MHLTLTSRVLKTDLLFNYAYNQLLFKNRFPLKMDVVNVDLDSIRACGVVDVNENYFPLSFQI